MPERLLRLAIAYGPHARAWELECAQRLGEVEGVRIQGCLRAPSPTQEKPRLLDRPFFRYQSTGNGLLAASKPSDFDTAWPRLQDAGDADVILLLGGGKPPDAFHGLVWAFRHADDSPHGFLPGIREALNKEAMAYFELCEMVSGMALERCCVPAQGDPLELAASMVGIAAKWPAAVARAMLTNPEAARGEPPERWPAATTPGPLRMLRFQIKRRFMQPVPAEERVHGAFNVGVLHQPIHVLLNEEGSRNVRWLPTPSKGKVRLEPFGYHGSDGELNVLFRKADEDGGSALIARVRPKPDNILKRSRVMLDEGHGAAYPFALTLGGETRVVISNRRERTVRLDHVPPLNDALLPGPMLVREALHAPTLFQHEGRWWLMGTLDPLPDALLMAWHAPLPEGPYTAHANGAIKCDLRSSRPAGTPFVHEGQLYRPALDASRADRPAVVIQRVLQLSPDVFCEETARRLDGFSATAYGHGVRTISAMGDITLVDGLCSPVVSAQRANASRSKRAKPSAS